MTCSDRDASIIIEVAARYERVICHALNQLEIAEVSQLILAIENGTGAVGAVDHSTTRRLAAEILKRARKLPVGPDRNDLRQSAIGLLWLDKRGFAVRAIRRLS